MLLGLCTGALASGDARYDAVLELVGTVTLLDSLACLRRGGVCCFTGILGDAWELKQAACLEKRHR